MEALTHLADLWWSWIVDASWQLALLVCLVALVAAVGRRLSAQFRYLLWTLVLLKVFLPPSVGMPWSVGNWGVPPVSRSPSEASGELAPSPARDGATGRALPAAENAESSRHLPVTGQREPLLAGAVKETRPTGQEDTEAGNAHPALGGSPFAPLGLQAVTRFAPLAWAMVCGMFLSLVALRYAWLQRQLRSSASATGGSLPLLLRQMATRLGRKSPPDLLLSEKISSPFLVGVFHPRIVLPASLPATLEPKELENVLLHELMHWKRRDVIIGWLQTVAQALFWFHPFLWFANSRLRHERESACDEAVQSLGHAEPRQYGESLLKVLLAARGRSTAAVGYLGIFERNTRLRKRLEHIMSLEKKSLRVGTLGWGFIAAFALAFLPMAGAGDSPPGHDSVHFVLGESAMTFEGEETSLDRIRSQLEEVPDRGEKALCFAVATRTLALSRVEPVKAKLIALSEDLGFKHLSDIGVHPLGSYGTAPNRWNDRFVKSVTVDIDHGPGNDRLSVQNAVKAICEAAGIPYQWEKSARLADPLRRLYIQAVHVEDVQAEKALLDVLNPAGLRFDMDKDGLYLYIPGGFEPAESTEVAKSLQDRIDEAPDGSTVKVPAGKHAGPLVIRKPLVLAGEGPERSVIELLGNEPTLLIQETRGVTVENLEVRWSPRSTRSSMEYPAAIAVSDSDAVIRGCRLEPMDRPEQTPYGLLAVGRSNVTFTQGSTTGFAYTLMFIEGANGTVSDSFLEKAGHSVVTLHPYSTVRIQGNILARCGYHAVRNTGGTMEMEGNLVADNYRAGAYLGNKPAHGTIVNNIFTGSNGEIWGYSRSDVELRNNLFLESKRAAIGCRDTCRLKVERNCFVSNPVGLSRYKYAAGTDDIGMTAELNHYWRNEQDTENIEKEDSALAGDPLFVDPAGGDFRPAPESPLIRDDETRVGLKDPEPLIKLWKRYKAGESATAPGKTETAAAPEVPEESPVSTGQFTPVDLQPKANWKLEEGFAINKEYAERNKDNTLENLPAGRQTFCGIPFQVGAGAILLTGSSESAPSSKVESIQVRGRATRIHFLHGTGLSGASPGETGIEDGTTIGKYVVHFDDGTEHAIPVAYGEHVRNWWSGSDASPISRGKLAWTGRNKSAGRYGLQIRLYHISWDNPEPDRKIESIDFMSTEPTKAWPFCVGITTEVEAIEESGSPDQKRLQGTWVGHAIENGKKFPCTLTLSGNQFQFAVKETGVWYNGRFTLDESADPGKLDAEITEASKPRYAGSTMEGIYRIEDGSFTIAGFNPRDPGRPTSFEPSRDNIVILLRK